MKVAIANMHINPEASTACNVLAKVLSKKGIGVTTVFSSAAIAKAEILIFPSADITNGAISVKKMFPEKIVILWTSSPKIDMGSGIIVVDKSQLRHFNKLVEMVEKLLKLPESE